MPASNLFVDASESSVAGPKAATVRLRAIIALPAVLLQLGCATSPDNIPAAPVSVEPYLKLDCAGLAAEHARISASLRDAQGLQAEQAERDSGAVAGALILFTPIILATGGNRPMTGEVARLKGERGAIDEAIARKGCAKP
jgi:hypothetical protein